MIVVIWLKYKNAITLEGVATTSIMAESSSAQAHPTGGRRRKMKAPLVQVDGSSLSRILLLRQGWE